MKYKIYFTESEFSDVELNENDELSENLTAKNSPILFGCRTGICGTCLIRVHEEGPARLHPRTNNEVDFLETLYPGDKTCRLACQIKINTNIKISKEKI